MRAPFRVYCIDVKLCFRFLPRPSLTLCSSTMPPSLSISVPLFRLVRSEYCEIPSSRKEEERDVTGRRSFCSGKLGLRASSGTRRYVVVPGRSSSRLRGRIRRKNKADFCIRLHIAVTFLFEILRSIWRTWASRTGSRAVGVHSELLRQSFVTGFSSRSYCSLLAFQAVSSELANIAVLESTSFRSASQSTLELWYIIG